MTCRSDAIMTAWSRARSATFDGGLLLTFPHKEHERGDAEGARGQSEAGG